MPTTTYNFSGGQQNYTVPSGVTSITIECRGAQGGSDGGKGARVVVTNVAVTPGEVLAIFVGGKGGNGATSQNTNTTPSNTAGYNGGGNGGNASETGFGTNTYYRGGGGGGASDVRRGGTSLSNRIVCAGGGGGRGQPHQVVGGVGGQNGTKGASGNQTGCEGGFGATQSAAGAGGTLNANAAGFAGSSGQGGAGSNGPNTTGNNPGCGGGGGGGWFGGGGAGGRVDFGENGSGGGGSSNSTVGSTTTYTSDFQSGDGQVLITTNEPPNVPTNVARTGQETDATPNFSATITDPEGNNCQVEFELSTSGGTLIGTVTSAFVSSGSTATAEYTSALAVGSYRVRARGIDTNNAVGAYSGYTAFDVTQSIAPKDVSLQWNLNQLTNKDLGLVWDVNASNNKEVGLLWHVLKTVDTEVTFQWKLRTAWVLAKDEFEDTLRIWTRVEE